MKILLLIILVLVILGLPYRTEITRYLLHTDKIQDPVRFIVLSDLHNQPYGKDMHKLTEIIRREKPDAILMPGDMRGDYRDNHALRLFELLKDYPVYYVTGNHEENHTRKNDFLRDIEARGGIILDHTSRIFQKGNTCIEIGGIACQEETTPYTVQEINDTFTSGYYRILLSHLPHWMKIYGDTSCDLVVTGHAHGGQFRIPFTKIGVAAPQQGFFPKMIDGIRRVNHTYILVSRGLVRHYHGIPRLYNDPEIIILDLLPEEKEIPVMKGTSEG